MSSPNAYRAAKEAEFAERSETGKELPEKGKVLHPAPGAWTVRQIDYPAGKDISFEVVSPEGVVLQTIMREIGDGWRNDLIEQDRRNAHIAAASCDLRDALAAAVTELKQQAEFFGPCDHDVGLCCCPLYGLIERCEATLAAARAADKADV